MADLEIPTGYTPGPWTYEIHPSDSEEKKLPKSEWSGVFIGPESDEPPSGIYQSIFEGGFTHGPKDGDPEADLRLIALAPELADAFVAAQVRIAALEAENGRLGRKVRDLRIRAEGAEKDRDERLAVAIEMEARAEAAEARTAPAMAEELTAAQVRIEALEAALAWYGENARLCRLVHSEGDKGRHNLETDGGKRAAALAPQPKKLKEPKS